MNFCGDCGKPVTELVPDGDNRLRWVCTACTSIHYQNPRMVIGCVPEYRGEILLCKRSIEPRFGYWTVPAGFMELGETMAEAAIRETQEEALAEVELGPLFALVDVVHGGQVHAFFEATLPEPAFGAGAETSEARLYAPADIPWDELAFPSVRIALEQYLARRGEAAGPVHISTAPRIRWTN